MPRYRVSIAEQASYDLIVNGAGPAAAGDRALAIFGASQSPEIYLAAVRSRAVETVVMTDEPLSPVAIAVADALKALEGVDLDDLVHEVKASEASDINDGGREKQVRYLLAAGMTLQEMQEAA